MFKYEWWHPQATPMKEQANEGKASANRQRSVGKIKKVPDSWGTTRWGRETITSIQFANRGWWCSPTYLGYVTGFQVMKTKMTHETGALRRSQWERHPPGCMDDYVVS